MGTVPVEDKNPEHIGCQGKRSRGVQDLLPEGRRVTVRELTIFDELEIAHSLFPFEALKAHRDQNGKQQRKRGPRRAGSLNERMNGPSKRLVEADGPEEEDVDNRQECIKEADPEEKKGEFFSNKQEALDILTNEIGCPPVLINTKQAFDQ